MGQWIRIKRRQRNRLKFLTLSLCLNLVTSHCLHKIGLSLWIFSLCEFAHRSDWLFFLLQRFIKLEIGLVDGLLLVLRALSSWTQRWQSEKPFLLLLSGKFLIHFGNDRWCWNLSLRLLGTCWLIFCDNGWWVNSLKKWFSLQLWKLLPQRCHINRHLFGFLIVWTLLFFELHRLRRIEWRCWFVFGWWATLRFETALIWVMRALGTTILLMLLWGRWWPLV
jgi:hypothetical protein